MQQKLATNKALLIVFFLIIILSFNVAPSLEASVNSDAPKWSLDLPSRCNSPADCEISSPVLADINDDGKLDIIVATSNGHVMAISDNGNTGQTLWNRDVSPYFGMAANTQQINSSPAVADIDNDGRLEVIVGTGTIIQSNCTQGGVIVLDHNGVKQPGWPFFTLGDNTPPAGCTDTIFSTPALGDIDNDGTMEIVAGGFDKRIYVLHHDGALDSNFPIDSELINRFPTWTDLQGKLADSIWGSPALADIDGDDYLDIILGTDEGNFDSNFPDNMTNWSCPYAMPAGWPTSYCGGALYVLDRHGNHLPGFPKRIHETIQSSPAIYDINQDGKPEIFVGTGTFYHNNSPSHPTTGFRIYGWDNEGNDLPGWEGGKVTGGTMPAAPSIGDIAGDSRAEVVALGMDQKLYAWFADGSPVPGFPMTPLNEQGKGVPYNTGHTPVLGDYHGDDKMEIFIRTAWSIAVVDGNGQQLTTTTNPPNNPFFYTHAALQNNPAVGDIDNDGKLELIAHNSSLYVWDLPNAGDRADWPMARYNAARIGHPIYPMLQTPQSLTKMQEISNLADPEWQVTFGKLGNLPIEWTAVPSNPDITVSPSSGTITNETTITVTVDRNQLSAGSNNVGHITINGTANGDSVLNSPSSLSITVNLVDEITNVYLPILQK
ncbi:MAG: hypothetical protein GY803_02405 [Chloroflexi bacterium]|nr:hypothetical protein [Chloroflexota bacterium]